MTDKPTAPSSQPVAHTPGDSELADRLFAATIGTLELFSAYLGWGLGLYQALADGEATSPAGLSQRAGIHPRYAREWLEQQAVAGFLAVEQDASNEERLYRLSPERAAVLADPEHPLHVLPFAPMLVGIAGALPLVAEAYRNGDGVRYAHYGSDFRQGQAGINRPAFVHDLPDWIASMPDVDERLGAEPPAWVADVGCGEGWSTLALAATYPRIRVEGIDLDEASIRAARGHAAASGVGDRLSFVVRDATDLSSGGPYDLVCFFEALHDLPRPVETLTAVRAALAAGGSVLVVDERVADRFATPGDEIERMMYGWSVTHCLPAAMVDERNRATGTVLRADTLRRLAEDAGFTRVEILPIENDLFRFYRLLP